MTEALENEIADAESQWSGEGPVPVSIKEVLPETSLVVKASAVFETQLVPIDMIIKRRAELGVVDASKCGRDKEDSLRTINGLCRKANGDTDRVSDALKEEALNVQRVVNGLKKTRKERIAAIQKPITDKFAEWAAEDDEIERQKILAQEAVKRQAEEAKAVAEKEERERLLALENARLAAQAEANQKERDRLLAERQAMEVERKKAEQERIAADARVAAKLADERKAMAEEKRRLDAELDARLSKERSDFEERQKAEREKLEAKRLADQAEMAKIEAELAEFRAQKAKADAEFKRLAEEEAQRHKAAMAVQAAEAAAKAEAERKARMAPDAERMKTYGQHLINVIASAPSVTSPEAVSLMKTIIAGLTVIADRLQNFGAPNS